MRSLLRIGPVSAALCAAFMASVPSCKGDDDSNGAPNDSMMCANSGGPVEDGAKDLHCTNEAGDPIIQTVGRCQSELETGAGGASGVGAGGAAGAADEEYTVLTGHEGSDDDCKYDVSFTNTCVQLNTPVTFKVTLTTRATGEPATGAHPDSPEVYFASEPQHISPSFEITAKESPPGTYSIGPIVFDRSGRWVVRHHFYENCSDVPADSPHGHIAFYIDVP
jgi:hypothetical protein